MRNLQLNYVAFKDLWNENKALKEQIAALEAERNRLFEAKLANERLTELLEIRTRILRESVAATVISNSASSWFRTLTVDKGNDAGIHQGMAVITPRGVVGRVVSVEENTAKVMLLTDHKSGLDIITQRTRVRGIVSGSVDGELYALPDYNRQPFAKYLWIRNDWQDAVGLPDPKTMDDVIELARAFATQDPDGNGKDDTFGLPLDKDFKFLGEGFFAGYGAYPANFIADMWLERDGRLEFAGVQPEVRTALGKLREMHDEGLLDPEFVVKDRGAAYGDVAAGKFGLLYGERWNPAWPLRQFRDNNPDEDWHWVDLPSEDGSVALSPSNLKPPTFFAVRADYPNPEAMIKLYNHTYVHGSTREADLNVYDEGISINHVRLFHNIRMFAGNDMALRLNAALADGDTSRLSEGPEMRTYNQVKAYADGETGVTDNWVSYRVNGPDGPMVAVGELYDSDHFVYNRFYGPLGSAYLQRGATLNSMKEEVFAKIIIGEEPLEAFDTFVEDWYRLGGQDVTDEVNEWWQTTK
jgi:putative aldouronate transport system substrate-binding protein